MAWSVFFFPFVNCLLLFPLFCVRLSHDPNLFPSFFLLVRVGPMIYPLSSLVFLLYLSLPRCFFDRLSLSYDMRLFFYLDVPMLCILFVRPLSAFCPSSRSSSSSFFLSIECMQSHLTSLLNLLQRASFLPFRPTSLPKACLFDWRMVTINISLELPNFFLFHIDMEGRS